MITLSQILKHYKRADIQNAIIENAQDKEVAIKFGDKGFGKRPDILKYPKDILELAKQGSTSFHASEELWSNPLRLDPMMKRKDIEDLRIGWDLVLDIDSIDFEFSKIISDLIIRALKMHGIKSISCKFSGNKGFHIGVPFETFPKYVDGKEISLLFPEAARRIAKYLIYFIDSKEMDSAFTKKLLEMDKTDIIKKIGKKKDDVIKKICDGCKNNIPKKEVVYFYGCSKCGYTEKSNLSSTPMRCKQCKSLMRRIDRIGGQGSVDVTGDKGVDHKRRDRCPICDSDDIRTHIDPYCFIDVDTLLISSRHLYRMAYSFNEKSGLVSVPVNPNKVMDFRKEIAISKNVRVSKYKFLDRTKIKKNEAKKLLVQAFDFNLKHEEVRIEDGKQYEIPEEAIPEKFFPPCIRKILNGLEDGKKRSMFILTNFLSSIGWDYEQIEKILEDWNKKNPEPLREVLIKGQIRYHKQRKKKILPPNCANSMYYKDFRICLPDNFCQRIKNPVNYAVFKAKSTNREVKKGGPILTEEQKEMRRRFRERKKKENKK